MAMGGGVRGDEEAVSGDLFKHIIQYILRARFIIANIEGRNANVFYELGLAQALDKAVILVSKESSEIPFDVRGNRIVFYQTADELRTRLMNEIGKISLSLQDHSPSKRPEFGEANRRILSELDKKIMSALAGKKFTLVYNPETKREKIITFEFDGTIGEGRNRNESSWRVVAGRLEILDDRGSVHSRFVMGPDGHSFNHTNDADTQSIRGQFLMAN